jgi:hypothetical protein
VVLPPSRVAAAHRPHLLLGPRTHEPAPLGEEFIFEAVDLFNGPVHRHDGLPIRVSAFGVQQHYLTSSAIHDVLYPFMVGNERGGAFERVGRDVLNRMEQHWVADIEFVVVFYRLRLNTLPDY